MQLDRVARAAASRSGGPQLALLWRSAGCDHENKQLQKMMAETISGGEVLAAMISVEKGYRDRSLRMASVFLRAFAGRSYGSRVSFETQFFRSPALKREKIAEIK